MADIDNARQRIVSSVFDKRNAAGQQETYVGHLKIWEDADDGVKPRYIIISHANNASGFIHKSKLNTNGTFSVGKTWNLAELRGIEVANSLNVNITLSRTYKWRTEHEPELLQFVNGLIRTFRSLSTGTQLRLVGVQDPDTQHIRQSNDTSSPGRLLPSSAPPNVGYPAITSTSKSRPGNFVRSSSPVSYSETSLLSSRHQPARSPSPISHGMQNPQHATRPVTPSRDDMLPRTAPATTPRSRRPSNASRSVTPEVPKQPRSHVLPPALTETLTTPGSIALRQGRTISNASSITPSSVNGSSLLLPSLKPPTLHGSENFLPSRPSLSIQSSPSAQTSRSGLLPPGSSSQLQSISTITPLTPSRPRTNSPAPPPSPVRAVGIVPTHSAILSAVPENQQSTESLVAFDRSSSTRKTPTSSENPSDASPALPAALPRQADPIQTRNARISFFDPANQMALDRLIAGDYKDINGVDGEDETVQATLASVEEMLEGYEWATDDILGRKGSTGTAEQIEARLLDELLALEKANVHSFIESDDRVNLVVKYLEDSITELDAMDSYVSSYKIHLNEVADDISYIQSQNRGLQVQTQNQRALISELEQLLQTVHVDREVLVILTQESLEKSKSVQKLEEAAAELYKALQTGRDREIAATMERLGEYKTYNAQFCKRMLDYLSIMFTAQAKMLLGAKNGIQKSSGKGRVSITDHKNFEDYLGRYSGLILYLKEMDESVYGKLCAAYFSAASELHNMQMQTLFKAYTDALRKAPEDDTEQTFSGPQTALAPRTASGIRRAGTIVRGPLGKDKERQPDGDLRGSEALSYILEALAPQIRREQLFIADFLQINEADLTFADYMGLENYFRRQAMRFGGLSQATSKLVRGAMDLIFGFLPAGLKTWIDVASATDNLGVIGLIASMERFMSLADERDNAYLFGLLEKHHTRLKGVFDRHVNEQIKVIEDTKVTSKKRKGVVPFVKYFPVYVGRVESQIIETDSLEIRQVVDTAYDKIVQSMFDCLKHMAKLDGEGEDKGQLNYHVILIENMHHFVAEIAKLEIGSVVDFLKRAEAIYDESLNAYVKLVLRRPFFKILDYFEGVERLLKTTAPTEVASNSSYNKSALKKTVKEYNSKDVRKHVDALFKRVEKHFTEASDTSAQQESGPIAQGTVMVGVWKACEEELVRVTELFQKRISQCYANSGISLEYTLGDVESAFRRHKVGG